MKTFKRWIGIALFSLVASTSQADVLVLVHGYLGSAHSWDSSGVNHVLKQNGWQYHGVLFATPQGVQLAPVEVNQSSNRFYSVELPSQAPVMMQAQLLKAMLSRVAQLNPGQHISIAAHSAGGVVARAALVMDPVSKIVNLISIASPHLGTARAAQALEATDMPWPFCLAQNFLTGGKTRVVRNSRGLLMDLLPPYPGSFLHWLNAQPHPVIGYHSILRSGPVGMGDQLVPLASQDMNNLPALASRSSTLLVPADHWLVPQDGQAIADLLAN